MNWHLVLFVFIELLTSIIIVILLQAPILGVQCNQLSLDTPTGLTSFEVKVNFHLQSPLLVVLHMFS
jgi:hypothetical protein